jgi:hypothetical protein
MAMVSVLVGRVISTSCLVGAVTDVVVGFVFEFVVVTVTKLQAKVDDIRVIKTAAFKILPE